MLNAIGLIAVFTLTLFCVLHLAGIKIIGRQGNPFGLFFGINFLLMSVPGILLVSSPGVDTILNSGVMSVSEQTIQYVTTAYLYSLVILVVMVLMASLICHGFHVGQSLRPPPQAWAADRFVKVLLWCNCLYLAALFAQVGISNIPLIQGFTGDLSAAKVLKANLIRGDIKKLPESLNQLFRILIPLGAFIAADRYFSSRSDRKTILPLMFSFLLGVVYYSYELQKAPVFIFSIGILFFFVFHRGVGLRVILAMPLLVVGLLGVNAFFFELTSVEDIGFLIEKVANRLFIMQNQGMFYIVEHIRPDINYLKTGAIFSSYIFEELPRRADAVVMEIMYGFAEANVNMNTYFIGQAYSIAGMPGVIFGSFVIGSHLCLYLICFKKLYKKDIGFFMPLSVVFYLYFVPINQGFNSFLYARNLIFFIFFGYVSYRLYRTKLLKKRHYQKVQFLSNSSRQL